MKHQRKEKTAKVIVEKLNLTNFKPKTQKTESITTNCGNNQISL